MDLYKRLILNKLLELIAALLVQNRRPIRFSRSFSCRTKAPARRVPRGTILAIQQVEFHVEQSDDGLAFSGRFRPLARAGFPPRPVFRVLRRADSEEPGNPFCWNRLQVDLAAPENELSTARASSPHLTRYLFPLLPL
jgi:hypothetical protein